MCEMNKTSSAYDLPGNRKLSNYNFNKKKNATASHGFGMLGNRMPFVCVYMHAYTHICTLLHMLTH